MNEQNLKCLSIGFIKKYATHRNIRNINKTNNNDNEHGEIVILNVCP